MEDKISIQPALAGLPVNSILTIRFSHGGGGVKVGKCQSKSQAAMQ